MKNLSDLQALALVSESKSTDMLQIYHACVAVACNGLSRAEEQQLPSYAKDLLEVRRFLNSSSLQEADSILHALRYQEIPLIFTADRVFLEGQVLHRRGFQSEALIKLNEAADIYHQAGDYFRELRSRSNAYIANCDLRMCLFGELVALEQKARRLGYLEIAANICRARAEQLMQVGRFDEAVLAAEEAVSLYQSDGYPDDQAVAVYLAALSLMMLGKTEQAHQMQFRARVSDGKVSLFSQAYSSLRLGKMPDFPYGHPMKNVPWKVATVKSNSIPGKIIDALTEGPKSRDELVEAVWGQNAIDPSYNNRLYVALSSLKKTKKIQIEFDGEKYLLSS